MSVRTSEADLIARMIRRYCADHHGTSDRLCVECAALLDYARERLAKCPYGDAKPTCRKCPIHCYRPDQRARIRDVMHYAGPRLVAAGDFGALEHLLHSLKKAPSRPGGKTSARKSH